MSQGLFLVGTARGVGKTLLGAGLVGLLRKHGVDATMMTPIATGGSTESATSLLHAVGVDDPPRLTSPVVFETMAAPMVASRVEGRPVDVPHILAAFRELAGRHRFVVVEGGGVLVPIARRYMMIDLLEELDLPSIIVGRSGRGTLNHCLLTERAMLSRGVHPTGFVLNGYGQYGDGFAESLNPDVLAELAAPTPVLATLEWRPGYQSDIHSVVSALERQDDLLRTVLDLASQPARDAAS
jgi:dethiobiotin synthetase